MSSWKFLDHEMAEKLPFLDDKTYETHSSRRDSCIPDRQKLFF